MAGIEARWKYLSICVLCLITVEKKCALFLNKLGFLNSCQVLSKLLLNIFCTIEDWNYLDIAIVASAADLWQLFFSTNKQKTCTDCRDT